MRADALFELTDAILIASSVPSLPHLSVVPIHRRGWGSIYAALSKGRIDQDLLGELLDGHSPEDNATRGKPRVYAVDLTAWPRCDAESSPERGYYYHPSRYSAGQPIVAGWAYQLIAEIGFARDTWVAPVDVRRLRPVEDDNTVAQVRDLLGRLPHESPSPLFVFDAGYDPVKLERELGETPLRLLVRLHSNRVFYADPEQEGPRPVGRAKRYPALKKAA